jgi:hypothetical protein
MNLNEGSGSDTVICHWFDTGQGKWRDDLVSRDYCINQLQGTPQKPSPDPNSATRTRPGPKS